MRRFVRWMLLGRLWRRLGLRIGRRSVGLEVQSSARLEANCTEAEKEPKYHHGDHQ